MELTLRPATPTERLYAKRQCIPIMERCGSPGILVAELDDSGTAFYSHWDIWDPAWKTPEFSVELDAMIEMLRSDQRYGPVLKNIPAMIAYCLNNQESRIIQSPEYLFRVDADYHAYLLRCTPSELLDNAYIYAYRRDLLERHMKEAEKGIRFVTTDGKEKFRVSDGEQIRPHGTVPRVGQHRLFYPGVCGAAGSNRRHGDSHAFHPAGQVLCCAAQQ